MLSKLEGIIPALESAHAVAEAIKRAPTMPRDFRAAGQPQRARRQRPGHGYRGFWGADMQRVLQGKAALSAMFARARLEERGAFLPYFPIGYPTHEASLEAIAAMAAAGADGFEIGIPFSDPIADGPTIQAATQVALDNGTTVSKCLAAVRALRQRGIDQPMLLMGYLNPLVAYGAERFVQDARAAGADGLIVPDLPPEEAHYFGGQLRAGRAGACLHAGADQQRFADCHGRAACQRLHLCGVADGHHRRAGRSCQRICKTS